MKTRKMHGDHRNRVWKPRCHIVWFHLRAFSNRLRGFWRSLLAFPSPTMVMANTNALVAPMAWLADQYHWELSAAPLWRRFGGYITRPVVVVVLTNGIAKFQKRMKKRPVEKSLASKQFTLHRRMITLDNFLSCVC